MPLESRSGSIRIAVPFAERIEDFDTAEITRDYQYMLLQALYSPLLEHDYSSSQIVTGLASSFRWEESRFIVSLRPGLRTQSSYEITADDVIFTFMRQLQLSSNTHGDLRRLLCEEEGQDAACRNIEKIDKYTVAFNLRQRNADIIRTLTSIDFAIIPKSAVNPLTLRIEDYSETSGPMYYAGRDEQGQIVLKAQRSHWHRLGYDTAILFSDRYEEKDGQMQPRSIEAFKRGEIDLIPTGNIYSLAPDHYGLDFEHDLHVTQAIGLSYLHLTERGRQQALGVRQLWAEGIQRHLAAHPERLLLRRTLTRQFFMEKGFGGLDLLRQQWLKDRRSELSQGEVPKMRLGVHEGVYQTYQRLLGDLPFVELVRETLGGPRLELDARAALIDSSFDEDLNYFEYLFKENFLPLDREAAEQWLARYTASSDERDREVMAQDLHLAMIHSDISVIPLFSRPYVACSRKPWTLNLPKNYVNTPFWLIQKS